MPNQTMQTRCLGVFVVMWVPKLAQKRPNLARNWNFWSFWARPCWLIWWPIGGFVVGCGARAVSRKTPIYFITAENYSFIFKLAPLPDYLDWGGCLGQRESFLIWRPKLRKMGTLVTLALIAFSGLGVGNSFECETDEVSLCASKEDKTCVNKKVACSGNFLCEDKTDLDWCKKKERKEETCPRHYKRCSTETGWHNLWGYRWT